MPLPRPAKLYVPSAAVVVVAEEAPLRLMVAPATGGFVAPEMLQLDAALVKFTLTTFWLLIVTVWEAGVNDRPLCDGVIV